MCVIIHKPNASDAIPEWILDNSERINKDGFGITYLDGKMETLKTMDYLDARALLAVERPYVAHYRYATVGNVGEENCHPFPVNRWPFRDAQIYSNGTVKTLGTKAMTDTEAIAKMLNGLPRNQWHKVFAMTDVRFAVVDGPKVERFGEWHEEGGIWFSKDNVLKKPYVPKKYSPPKSAKKVPPASWQRKPSYSKPTPPRQHSVERVVGFNGGSNNDDYGNWQGYHYLAVYGTLKRGFNNNSLLDKAEFIGTGKTDEMGSLVGDRIPYLTFHLPEHHVEVEVYKVDSKQERRSIDILEGHPSHYRREKQMIQLDNGESLKCWIYNGSDSIHSYNEPTYSNFQGNLSDSLFFSNVGDLPDDDGYYGLTAHEQAILDDEQELLSLEEWFNQKERGQDGID